MVLNLAPVFNYKELQTELIEPLLAPVLINYNHLLASDDGGLFWNEDGNLIPEVWRAVSAFKVLVVLPPDGLSHPDPHSCPGQDRPFLCVPTLAPWLSACQAC